jgi:diguanylate cyclase (GGDEF)-like protein/PAS domain S-box-containing protein
MPTDKKIMPAQTSHLLIVEEVKEDLESIVLVLNKTDIAFSYDSADGKDQCEELLSRNNYDAVLSDFVFSTCNGSDIFESVRKYHPETPFILVTGGLGDEEAVDCIKRGITDYVLKDHLVRLPTVLQRALREFELNCRQRTALNKLQHQAWRDGILSEIVQSLNRTMDIEQLMQITVNNLHSSLKVSRCLISQPDKDQQMRSKYVSEATDQRETLIGISCDFYKYYHPQLSQGQQVVLSQIDPTLPSLIQQAGKDCNILSILITPLICNGEYVGGISLQQCDYQRTWTEDELQLLIKVAEHCAIALNQATLYQQLQTELQERQQAEIALRQSEQCFRALIENANDIIFILDAQGNITYGSPSVERVFRISLNKIKTKTIFDLIHPPDLPLVTQTIKNAMSNPGVTQNAIEFSLALPNGSFINLETIITNMINNQAVGGIVVNCHDITYRKKTERKLYYTAFYNQLTKLPNRHFLKEKLQEAIQLSQAIKEYIFALLFLDIDRFKVINDSLGHLFGDQLLAQIANRLRNILPSDYTLVYIGADEFAIFMEKIGGVEDAIKVAQMVQQIFRKPFLIDGYELFISASVGIALNSFEYAQPEHILCDADTAMSYAKNFSRGKGGYKVFDPSMHSKKLKQLTLETRLRKTIESEELLVYYQPIVSLVNNSLEGFEALVRWNDQNEGMISPTEFIPIAEETGLIVPLGSWVLKQACKQLSDWHQHFSNSSLTISVNVSGEQFAQSELIQEIDEILEQTGINGSNLKLEITESVLIDNADLAQRILWELRERKIKVSIDDFGTGYSSLSYLHRFPSNILKIDQSFVRRIGKADDNSAIIRTIINMSHELGLGLIAEGIETIEQLEFLKSLGCQSGQGYFFSKPVDAATMTELINKKFHLKDVRQQA